MTDETRELMKEIAEINLAYKHKPFNPLTEQHRKFLASYLSKTKALQAKHACLDLGNELAYFANKGQGSYTVASSFICIVAKSGLSGLTVNSCLSGLITTSISSKGIEPSRGSASPGKTMALQMHFLFLTLISMGATTSQLTTSSLASRALLFSTTGSFQYDWLFSFIASI